SSTACQALGSKPASGSFSAAGGVATEALHPGTRANTIVARRRRPAAVIAEPRLLTRLGGDQLPIRVTRRDVAREGPDVGHVGYFFGRTFDHVTGAIASHGNELRHETHRHLRGPAAQLRAGNVRLVDRNEPSFDSLAAGLALANR